MKAKSETDNHQVKGASAVNRLQLIDLLTSSKHSSQLRACANFVTTCKDGYQQLRATLGGISIKPLLCSHLCS